MKRSLFILCMILIMTVSANAQKFDDLALTPPMGWNSWNEFACDVDENLIKSVADAMVETGMKDAGYEYVVIDDCWQVDRDENGNIIPDPDRFPSGMKALADYIHAKGLKFGLYSDAGTHTCQGRPGSRGYEYRDARTYASWGVDYLKYDWCNTGTQDPKASYKTMRDALYAAGRPIVFSICEWGRSKPWTWAGEIGHLWRTTSDIQKCFDCEVNWGGIGVLQILDKQVKLPEYAGPGRWNDPDMLEVGNEGLTASENRAHFSLWCMLAAPLMAGNDIRWMSDETRDILTRKEVIALDQDPLGRQALRWMKFGEWEIWFKPLEGGDMAFCFLNRSLEPVRIDFDLKKTIYDSAFKGGPYRIDGSYTITDLWTNKVIGTTADPVKAKIGGHDVLLVRLSN